MYTTKIAYKLYIALCFFVLFTQEQLNAQIVIGTPNLGFSQACASESFNSYSTTFVFSPTSSLNASNQFTIEMSDADGDFSNPTLLYTSNPGSVTTSPATLNFSLPETTSGENFKIRIKSSAPAATSSNSMAFAAYYKIQDAPFTINNLVETAAYCSGGNYLLTIDNPGSGSNDSPLNYPSLTYNWYKETGPTTSIFVTEGTTLSVNEEGTYFVETNYGTCTSNSFSNRVTVTEVSSGNANAEIVSSLGNPFCPGSGYTTLTTLTGNSYQWFKNGAVIPEATNQMYETNESGTYAVQVDLGNCSATGAIELVSELFDATINVTEDNIIEEDESLSVYLITTANSPEFKWYLNDTIISDATVDNFEVTEFGSYKVIVSETSGCIASKEFTFEVNEAFDPFPDVEKIPNVVSPNGDGSNDTWIIPTKYVNGTDTNVLIMTNRGKIVLQTDNYLNNWPENELNLTNINQVFYYVITTSGNETKKGSITVVR
ncbi:T9SS type B sorting domain-containing protein [Psychroserpens ponticola]|uniref:Gliding motility-associated C-terminal domain-containing protein n=1 Tax=Psychroserpens ponticola TaxID=2932268 RepID=A0ABY7S166_9FLAO|nr:gliding motility-associated C-terminal domain-containing protein [Psychroserpens ponticola]WCO03129.1 gliding motility-associated C-terminal domain-containing protein [Psychroserpens ponticola]